MTFLRGPIAQRFHPDNYNLLSHNCNHFASEVAVWLCGVPVPDRIVNIANDALSTPQGQQLRGLIEGFEASMRSQPGVAGAQIGGGGNQGLNPFGNVGGSEFSAPMGMGGAPNMGGAMGAAAPFGGTGSAASGTPPPPDLEPIRAALGEIKGNESAEAQWNCITTVWKMTNNIVAQPGEPKFRKVGFEGNSLPSG